MKPLDAGGRRARASCSASRFFVLFVAAVGRRSPSAAWCRRPSWPTRCTMLRSGWTLLTEMGFANDIGMTVWRVLGGFADRRGCWPLPLGVVMGAYKPIEAFFEPFVAFARYLPASAFIPLLILWAGIGEAQKLVGDLHRQLLPAGADDRGDGGQHPARPGRGGLHAGRAATPASSARADPRRGARDRRDPAHGAGLGLDLRDRGRADRRVAAASAT